MRIVCRIFLAALLSMTGATASLAQAQGDAETSPPQVVTPSSQATPPAAGSGFVSQQNPPAGFMPALPNAGVAGRGALAPTGAKPPATGNARQKS